MQHRLARKYLDGLLRTASGPGSSIFMMERGHDKMEPTMTDSPLQRLRKSFSLADLPDTIATGCAGGDDAKPIELATVDDIAFAIQALNVKASAVCDPLYALRSLYDRARRAGAVGTAHAVDAAALDLDSKR